MSSQYYSSLSETELENFKIYKSQIRKIPLLSIEEERETARKMICGDEKAREKLISSNLHLVVPIAKSYPNPEISLLDLISEGNSGLVKATEKYDINKGKFSAYAHWWIKDSILTALNQAYSSIRLSFGMNEKITKARKYLDNNYSFKEVASIFHWTESQLAEFFGERIIQSLDVPISNGDKDCSSLIDAVYDNSQDVPNKFFINLESKTIMNNLKNILNPKEFEIIKMRYNWLYGNEMFYEDIGNFISLSGERVRQLHDRAVKKIKSNRELKEIINSGATNV